MSKKNTASVGAEASRQADVRGFDGPAEALVVYAGLLGLVSSGDSPPLGASGGVQDRINVHLEAQKAIQELVRWFRFNRRLEAPEHSKEEVRRNWATLERLVMFYSNSEQCGVPKKVWSNMIKEKVVKLNRVVLDYLFWVDAVIGELNLDDSQWSVLRGILLGWWLSLWLTSKGRLSLPLSWKRTYGRLILTEVIRRRDIGLGKWGLWEFIRSLMKNKSGVEKILQEGLKPEEFATQRRLIEESMSGFIERLARQGEGFGALRFLISEGLKLMKLATFPEDRGDSQDN